MRGRRAKGKLERAARRVARGVFPKRHRIHCAKTLVLPRLLDYFGTQLKFAMVTGSATTNKPGRYADLDIKIITEEASTGFRDAKSNPGLRETLAGLEKELGFGIDIKEWGEDFVALFPSLWKGNPVIIYGKEFAKKHRLLR